MTDLCDWMATRLDQHGDRSRNALVNSVRAAQLSVMLLQHGSWPTRALEPAELTVTARHRHLSWYTSMLNARPDDEHYFHLLTYLTSRITLYERMFADDAGSSRLWSAIWRGLSLSRRALHALVLAIRANTLTPAPEGHFRQAAEILLVKTGRAARDTIYASVPVLGPQILMEDATTWSKYFLALVNELKLADNTVDMIRNARPSLKDLAASPPINTMIDWYTSLTGDDFDENVARGINGDFWREDRRRRFGSA